MEIKRLDATPRMSRGVVHGGVLYTSGLVDTDALDVSGQTRNILPTLDALLEQAGTNRSRILFANIWLADISTNPPARATVESKLADKRFKVEIAVTAAL